MHRIRLSIPAAMALAVVGLVDFAPPAAAATPQRMMADCRVRAAQEFRTRQPNVETKYEGQRTDGTHAVNGTARMRGRTETFQCSFDRPGRRILRFVVNRPAGGGATQLPGAAAPGANFSATGSLNCARLSGQPMRSCRFGVVRRGGGDADVTVFWPDGGNRVIFFKNGRPQAYDQSQADGNARMTWTRAGDLTLVTIGSQRFEIIDAIVFGG